MSDLSGSSSVRRAEMEKRRVQVEARQRSLDLERRKRQLLLELEFEAEQLKLEEEKSLIDIEERLVSEASVEQLLVRMKDFQDEEEVWEGPGLFEEFVGEEIAVDDVNLEKSEKGEVKKSSCRDESKEEQVMMMEKRSCVKENMNDQVKKKSSFVNATMEEEVRKMEKGPWMNESTKDKMKKIEKSSCVKEESVRRKDGSGVEKEQVQKKEKVKEQSEESELEQRNRPMMRLEGLKVPTWNGDEREYYSWKRVFRNIMKDAGERSDQSQISRMLSAIPDEWRGRIALCSSMSEVWGEFEVVITKTIVQELVYGDFKRMRRIREETEGDIREFIATVRLFIRRMKDLGKEEETMTDSCLSDARYKIGEHLNRDYNNYIGIKGETPSLDSLLTYLAQVCQSIKQSKQGNSYVRGPISRNRTVNYVQRGVGKSGGAFVSATRKKCVLGCTVDHALHDCPRFGAKSVDERKKCIVELGRCFNCLYKGHGTMSCESSVRCRSCGGKHHSLLHVQAMNGNVRTAKSDRDLGALMPVLRVIVLDSDGRPHPATVMLDGGSDTSLVTRRFLEILGLEGTPIDLSYSTAGGGLRREKSELVTLQIGSTDFTSGLFSVPVLAVKQTCSTIGRINRAVFSEHPHLKMIEPEVYQDGGNVDILLGNDQAYLLRDIKVITAPESPENNPVGVKCILGWYIVGGVRRTVNGCLKVNTFSKVEDEFSVDRMIKSDLVGIAPTRLCTCSDKEIEESAFVKHVKETTEILPEGRLQVKMPWKDGFPSALPNNREKAIELLERRERQLVRDGDVEVYNEEVDSLVKRKVVMDVTEAVVDGEAAWYLNHRGIKQPGKSTALRIVFDSAAVYGGHSLNSALEKGPNYLNDLMKCLIGWREKEIGLTCDISKMFNQISMHPQDRPYHRFLWRDCDRSQPIRTYQWMRVPFGDKSSPSLANYCIKRLAEENQDKELAYNVLSKRIYVDDICCSVSDRPTAQQTMKEVEKVLGYGSFPIKGWQSNNVSLDQFKGENQVDVLGQLWDKRSDQFSMKPKKLQELRDVTKRVVMSLVSTMWDPLGILNPCMIKYRIALQDLWSLQIGWDDLLSTDEVEKWIRFREEIVSLFEVKLDRALKPEGHLGELELHGFSDGGEKAYGTCVFLRWTNGEDKPVCSFVASKALVAPMKRRSIPRIELMGCVIMSRLVTIVEETLEIGVVRKYLWVDSKTVLSWLHSEPRNYKAFVGTRIAEIQENQEVHCYHYIPSAMNPADQLTKPISTEELMEWHKGPKFLRGEAPWPEMDVVEPEIELERKVEKKVHVVINERRETDVISDVIKDCKTWSDAVEAVVKFRNRESNSPSGTDYANAEVEIYRTAQLNVDFENHRYKKLQPVREAGSGLVRVNGRLNKAEYLPQEIKNPIILGKDDVVSRLLATHYHERCKHAGYRRVKAEIQSKGLWICGIRDLLKSVAARCLYCRGNRREILTQKMGELPESRVEPNVKPFQNCAMDYFGPVNVKYGGRSVIEGHVLIITCMVTRAIHLELCTDLSTEKFLLAWRRFVCNRGVYCRKVWSDNGGSFVGAQDYLKGVVNNWNLEKIHHELAKDKVDFDWKMNCPLASHMNGVVESLIKSVRRALEATFEGPVNGPTFTYEEWCTILQEVSYLINSRPLFPEGDDPLEYPSITPNSLLHGHGIEVPQPAAESGRENPRDRVRAVQRRIQTFWERWMLFMPSQLLERNKWFRTRENLKIGDMVLLVGRGLKGKLAPRATWERGVVVNVYPGDDGLVRKVRVETPKGQYDRPISKLCLIATKEELADENI